MFLLFCLLQYDMRNEKPNNCSIKNSSPPSHYVYLFVSVDSPKTRVILSVSDSIYFPVASISFSAQPMQLFSYLTLASSVLFVCLNLFLTKYSKGINHKLRIHCQKVV